MHVTAKTTAVLIVGGGLVGLSAALFLQQLGVPFVLVERQAQGSPLPRSRGIHARTMELFRQVGVEDAVQAAAEGAWKQGAFGGAQRGRSLREAVSIVDIAAMKTNLASADPSPSRFAACPQTLVEPILRGHLEARGGDVRFGVDLLSLVESGDVVHAILRGPRGQTEVIDATWLIGADGGNSSVRRLLGVSTRDTPAPQHLLNLFFEADLADLVEGRTFSQCEVANDQVQGLFLAMNNTDKWSFHLAYDPAVGPPGDARLPSLLRAAIGVPDAELRILSRGEWNTGVRIAERYRSGRTFLCGDAAHVMPPWGGFNANTGIADAHNLAWKLAAALQGDATPDLLDSYEVERRPLAVRNGRQSLLRTDFDARFGIETPANRACWSELMEPGALLMRYRYEAGTGNVGSTGHEDALPPVPSLFAQVGTRFPHAWIRAGSRRLSTLDLFGRHFVTLAGPASPRETMPGAGLAPATAAVHVVGRDVHFDDPEASWEALTRLPDDGAVMVRPDGFVAWRSGDPERIASTERGAG